MQAPSVLKYCPRCSNPARSEAENHFLCDHCGFEFYFNTAAATGGIILNSNGEILLTRRNHDPKKGFLDLPGGFVNFRETAEQALAREIHEELKIEITATRYFCSIPNTYEFRGLEYHTLDLFFLCQAHSLEHIAPNEEIMEILFRTPKEIDPAEMGFSSMQKLMEKIRSEGIA